MAHITTEGETAEGTSADGEPGPRSTGAGLSTFEGVFTPSILTILGVIMYLRFGWVVGNVGLLGTLAIVTLSTGITFLTSLSIAAIATDRLLSSGTHAGVRHIHQLFELDDIRDQLPGLGIGLARSTR